MEINVNYCYERKMDNGSLCEIGGIIQNTETKEFQNVTIWQSNAVETGKRKYDFVGKVIKGKLVGKPLVY